MDSATLAAARRAAKYDPTGHPHFYCDGAGYGVEELANGRPRLVARHPSVPVWPAAPPPGQTWAPPAWGHERRLVRCLRALELCRARAAGIRGLEGRVRPLPEATYPDTVVESYLLGGLSSGIGLDELGRRRRIRWRRYARAAGWAYGATRFPVVAAAWAIHRLRKRASGHGVGPPPEDLPTTEEQVYRATEDRTAPKVWAAPPPGAVVTEPGPRGGTTFVPPGHEEEVEITPEESEKLDPAEVTRPKPVTPPPPPQEPLTVPIRIVIQREEAGVMPSRAEKPPALEPVPGEEKMAPDHDDETVPPPFEDETEPPEMREKMPAQHVEPTLNPEDAEEVGTLRQFEPITTAVTTVVPVIQRLRRLFKGKKESSPPPPPPPPEPRFPTWGYVGSGAVALAILYFLLRSKGRR